MEREREFMEYLAGLKVSEAVRQSTLAISEEYLGFSQTYPTKAGVQALQDFCQQFVVGDRVSPIRLSPCGQQVPQTTDNHSLRG
jgi:hypothetical protein